MQGQSVVDEIRFSFLYKSIHVIDNNKESIDTFGLSKAGFEIAKKYPKRNRQFLICVTLVERDWFQTLHKGERDQRVFRTGTTEQ